MRDKEFVEIFEKQLPKLELYFGKRIKNNAARTELVEDLAWLTALLTLEYSRRPQSENYTIERLIFLKAKKVYADYLRDEENYPSAALDEAIEVADSSATSAEGIHGYPSLQELKGNMDAKSWKAFNMIAEGYPYSEIAIELKVSPESLRMLISRQRAKIRARYSRKNL